MNLAYTPAPDPAAAAARRILIVEDVLLLAMMLDGMLSDLGHRTLRAARVSSALDLARSAPLDCAFLDVNLNGETSYPVARELRQRGIPVIFMTGYGTMDLDSEFRASPVLTKPYSLRDLRQVLDSTLAVDT